MTPSGRHARVPRNDRRERASRCALEGPRKWEEVIVVTKERFGQGMTAAGYIAQMSMNKERFLAALDSTAITPRDAQVLARFPATCRILVITED